MSLFGSVVKAAAKDLGSAYDYLTPGKGSSRLTDWGNNYNIPAAGPTPNLGGGGGGSGSNQGPANIYYPPPPPAAPIPRLVTMDVNAAWNQAAQMATAAVTPIYQQKMADFLATQAAALKTQQDQATQQTTALNTTLEQQLEDSAKQRTRTSEDTTSTLQNIGDTQAYNERTGGLSYDAASRALNTGLGAAGTAESGIGQGQVEQNKTAYNLQSNEQLRQSNNQKAAASTLMTRTFEDLGTSDTRNTATRDVGKSNIEVNLQDFIGGQQADLNAETHNEAVDQAGDIALQTVSNEGRLVSQWLASLAGKGYTSQEIANAAAIYGR